MLPTKTDCQAGKMALPAPVRLEIVTQTDQVHVAQIVGAGGEYVFVIRAEHNG
jgi:hypothetical protein